MNIFRKDLLPEYMKNRNHDDWLPGFRWIPRRWTSYCFPMPPHKVLGNAEYALIDIQPGYPLASDAEIIDGKLRSMHPVHAPGQWSLQSVKLWNWMPRIPCYFTVSWKMFGRRFHFNIGCKPDITLNDFHWGCPEASFTNRALRPGE